MGRPQPHAAPHSELRLLAPRGGPPALALPLPPLEQGPDVTESALCAKGAFGRRDSGFAEL